MPPRGSVLVLVLYLLFCAAVAPIPASGEPQSDQILVLPPDPAGGVVQGTSAPRWGDDVRVCSNLVRPRGKGQTASVADTSGGIYVAVNEVYQDSLSRIVVYRSTDGGRTWGQIGGFRSTQYPIQSFDMCISDTSAGEWLLGFAFIIKTDESVAGGGQLVWGSMLSGGSHGRIRNIGKLDASTCFRNPSICTDAETLPVKDTFFYVAAELVTPSNDQGRGVYVNRSEDWGDTWLMPDTSIHGTRVENPTIGVDLSTNPDSLCIAFAAEGGSNGRDIFVARNTIKFDSPWAITHIEDAYDKFHPSMAIDYLNGIAMVTYTRNKAGAPTKFDVMYVYSRDQFRSFLRDSIATSTAYENLVSVTWGHIGSTYNWRVAYISSGDKDTVLFKSIMNKVTGLYEARPTVVNQYAPSVVYEPVVGFDRDIGGTTYRGNCIYVGSDGQYVYFDGTDLTLDVGDTHGRPVATTLYQNYPNPFNPSTTITYALPRPSQVRVSVYDILGREVSVLVNERREAGVHEVKLDASGLSSGVYLYRLEAGDFVHIKKLLIVR